ncbi:Ionotropic receptor 245 [Frankliniella occidentalis]|nr:Ionotropic receptor 245 [Frankliniella occidentalis]
MSTGSAALAVALLCLAAGEASADAVTVLKSRVVRHPEVPCALDLIPPLFQRADNDSPAFPPRLFVVGKTDWLDEFLRRFPSVASIYVFTPTKESVEKFQPFFLAAMMPSASIVLRIGGAGHKISFPLRTRVIFWISSDSNIEADDELPRVPDIGHRFLRLMLTTQPRGTTHVFSFPMPLDMARTSSLVTGELLGVWSPAAGWSAPHVPIFPPLCASWQPPPNGQPLLAEMFEYYVNGTATLDNYTRTEAYEVLRLLRDSYGLVFQTKVGLTTEVLRPFSAADTCRLDVLAFPERALVVDHATHDYLSSFPWESDSSILLVPAGAGKPRPFLYPLTGEYTPAVWAALASVVLAVVACLYLLRRDESVQELVLQTLSPLLGQPLDDRRAGPQIAILGGWLLTCVVVVAAYQGQLLGFITVPPQNREINSWQDWLESDLVLLVENNYFKVSNAIQFGLYGLTEDRIVRHSINVGIETIVTRRNASLLIGKHNYDILIRNEEVKSGKKVQEVLTKIHTFVPPMIRRPHSSFVTSKGSPFEVPLRKIFGRIRAAGGFRYDRNHTNTLPQATEEKPISLLNAMPIFAAYIAGIILAVLTFLLEVFLPTLLNFKIIIVLRKPNGLQL